MPDGFHALLDFLMIAESSFWMSIPGVSQVYTDLERLQRNNRSMVEELQSLRAARAQMQSQLEQASDALAAQCARCALRPPPSGKRSMLRPGCGNSRPYEHEQGSLLAVVAQRPSHLVTCLPPFKQLGNPTRAECRSGFSRLSLSVLWVSDLG